jgi:NAD(P)-dependent dehydrogenase (short-subunit alcohol dehydrogenase family)
VVTGANSGIGLETVVTVARLGFRAVGTVRSRAKAKVVTDRAAASGVDVATALLEVTDAEACAAVVDRTRPWGVVNNAGFSGTGAVEDVTDDEVRQQLEAMVIAPMRLARLALPHMREQGGGRIVNISSVYGRTTTPLSGWYQASKHALEAVSDALRLEVARDGVKVVLIEPGGFRTGIWDEFERDIDKRSPSAYAGAYGRTRALIGLAMPCMGEPAAVARAVGSALTSPAPRARYPVGLDAQAALLAEQVVPDRLRDRVIRLALGL